LLKKKNLGRIKCLIFGFGRQTLHDAAFTSPAEQDNPVKGSATKPEVQAVG